MTPIDVQQPWARNGVRDATLQKQLLERRDRLRKVLPAQRNPGPLYQLLEEVDAALDRMEEGTYGLCETCHEFIENERLLLDPLSRNCLEHLSPLEQRALERDLDLAFQVQNGLLPKPGPAGKGWLMSYHYRPAGPVSGDYCDLIRLDDGSSLFVLGDVMGKGVAASMLTAHLHAIFRSLGTPERPVSDLVTHANRVFCEGTLSSFFATLVCGRLFGDGVVELCNAGHCRPLHLHDGDVSHIEPTGLPLGLFPDAEYASHEARLLVGDGLVVHSDGLSEASNSAGGHYGLERLAEVLRQRHRLPPDQLLTALIGDLAGFCSNVPLADDLTVMVIRRES